MAITLIKEDKMELNKLLYQLACKFLKEEIIGLEEFQDFLNAVRESYSYFEHERQFMEDSMESNQKELQELNKKLAARESHFEEMTLHIPGMLYQFLMNSDGSVHFSYVSPASIDILELSPQEIENNIYSLLSLLSPGDMYKFRKSALASAKNLESWTWESPVTLASGKIKWIKAYSIPRKLLNKRILWNGVLIDITERKLAEEKLQESQRILSMLMNNLPGMVYRCLPDNPYTFTFISKGCKELTGFSAESLTEDRAAYFSLIHPEDRKRIVAEKQYALKKARSFELHYRIITPQGSEKWIWEQGSGLFGKEGRCLAVEGLLLDITKQKKAENTVKRRVELERLITTIATHFISLTHTGIDTAINEALQKAGNFIGAESTSVFLLSKDGKSIENSHSWPLVSRSNTFFADEFKSGDLPILMEKLSAAEPVIISPDTDSYTALFEEATIIKKKNIRSLIALPMVYGKTLKGFLSFGWNHASSWEPEDIAMLELLATVFVNALERKETEKAIKEQEQFLSRIINICPNLISVKDTNGNYTMVNEKFADVLDTTIDHLIGNKDNSIPEEILSEEESEGPVIPPVSSTYEEKIVHAKTGETHWYQTIKSPLYTPSGSLQVMSVSIDITAQKEALLALKRQQDYLEQIINANPNCIFVKDQEGRFTLVNNAFAQTYKCSPEQLLGKTDKDIHPYPVEIAFFRELDRQVLISQQAIPAFETSLTSEETKIITWYQTTKVPLQAQDGCIQVLTISTDITDRKLAAEEIQKQKSFYETILNKVPIDLAVFDLQHRYVYINPNAVKNEEIRKWLIGKDDFDYCHFRERSSDLAFKRRELFNLAVKEGKPVEMVEYLTDVTGKSSYNLKVFAPVYNENLDLIMVLGYGLDITERKLAEKKVRESEQLLKSINSNIQVGICRITSDGQPIYLNQAFADMFALGSIEEALQYPIQELYFSFEEEGKLAGSRNSDQNLTNREVLLKRKDGSSFWGLLSRTISTDNNLNTRYDIAVRDITQLKASEDLLIEQNAELEKINAELDRFVYSASHELRAPLTSLLGLIIIAKAEQPAGELNKYLDLMEKSVHRLDKFIGDIIHYSRNSRLDVQKEAINLENLLSEVLEDLSYLEGMDKINIRQEIEPDTLLFSDRSRIKVLLTNLISNAIKYHNLDQEQPYILISSKISQNSVLLKVEDNGKGIEEQHLHKVFEMFYRATYDAKGSGLGLYIVKETLNRLNGKIAVESKTRKGTTFTVEIPCQLSIHTYRRASVGNILNF